MRNFINKTLASSALLVITLNALASSTNQPPNYAATKVVGQQVNSGYNNSEAWSVPAVGAMTNTDAYTQAIDPATFVSNINQSCKDSKGNKTLACDFSQGLSGAQLLASSLLGFSGFPDAATRAAAVAFVQNLTNISPLAYPGDDKVFKDSSKTSLTPDVGVSYYAQLFKSLPSLSVGQLSMLKLFADRDTVPGLAGTLPVPGAQGGAASLMQMLDYEGNRRYTDPTWFDAMTTATDQAVMREIAYMLAFQNYMAVKEYKQSQRMEALTVALISAINNMNNQSSQAGSSTTQNNINSKASSQAGPPS